MVQRRLRRQVDIWDLLCQLIRDFVLFSSPVLTPCFVRGSRQSPKLKNCIAVSVESADEWGNEII